MLSKSRVALILIIYFFCMKAFSGGGQLLYLFESLCKESLYPYLMENKICISMGDCESKDILLATSNSDAIHVNVYGIQKQSLIAGIVDRVKKSKAPVSGVTFYKEPHDPYGNYAIFHTVVAKYRFK